MIRVEALWLAIEPLDMLAGTEAALARVARVFGVVHHTTRTCPPTDVPWLAFLLMDIVTLNSAASAR